MKDARRRRSPRVTSETNYGWAAEDESPTYKTAAQTAIERLKQQLLLNKLEGENDPDLNPLFRRAANEAAALAWATPFPLLLFPELFEEKARQARRQALTQARILSRSTRMNLSFLAEVA